jgi:membrane-associated phospholipid phosphatase
MLIDKFAIPFIFAFVVGCYLLAKTKLSYILDYFKLSEIKSQLKKLDKKLIVAFFSLLLTIASVQFVKLVYPQDRPCATDLYLEKIACPSSSTFPSTHTATAATFAAFSIGTPIFIPATLRTMLYYVNIDEIPQDKALIVVNLELIGMIATSVEFVTVR